MEEEDDRGKVIGKGDQENTQLATPTLTPVLEHTSLRSLVTRANNGKTPSSRGDLVGGQEVIPGPIDGISEAIDAARDRSQSSPLQHLQTNGDEIAKDTSASNSNRRLTTPAANTEKPEILKLSAAQIKELTSEPESIPVRQGTPVSDLPKVMNEEHYFQTSHPASYSRANGSSSDRLHERSVDSPRANGVKASSSVRYPSCKTPFPADSEKSPRPETRDQAWGLRSVSTPLTSKENTPGPKVTQDSSARLKDRKGPSSGIRERQDSSAGVRSPDASAPDGLKALQENMKASASKMESLRNQSQPLGTTPAKMPLPPLSMPTHLHLELSSSRPSPLYLHRSASYEYPYEPSRVKFERLLNFLLLPPQLERILLFGALTCLDAWLYTFTILPLRFVKALWILLSWAVTAAMQEVYGLPGFVYNGLGRIWRRYRKKDYHVKSSPDPSSSIPPSVAIPTGVVRNRQLSNANGLNKQALTATSRPRAASSIPKLHKGRSSVSLLLPTHKADIIQGSLMIASCALLMRFDASRMYHSVRGQAAIKLYVIYNVLEVFDRLFSALGQDVIECLFSDEILERKSNGRSKVIRPFWMFLLALAYTVIHATALLYQVITLNVAVNSYSNALLTLLMSNQFVEIKGTVFKKFEKENLFQLTCADIVERFQLWMMLLIIALRNIVELGGLSIPSSSSDFSGPSSSGPVFSNNTSSVGSAAGSAPMRTFNIIPHAFTLIPSIVPAQVLMPFLLVLGSEMLVDWLKHAYITKFNATKPALYSRFLDVLAKDYYSNAFASQNLTKRLGLPVIPLACLFIRSALQTYHMFLATTIPAPILSSSTSLSDASSSTSSPALAQIDHIFRSALGHSSSFGSSGDASSPGNTSYIFPLSLVQYLNLNWTLDDTVALATKLTFFALLYLLLLALKLTLGMGLLHFSRGRYAGMKARQEQERASAYTERESRRLGGWCTIEVGEDRRRTIYEGDDAGLHRAERGRAPEKSAAAVPSSAAGPTAAAAAAGVSEKRGAGLEFVDRYSMVAKRIW